MSKLHPLDIPELREYISFFLDFRGLCACATVCRAWYENIQPRIWRIHRINPSRLLTHGQEAWVAVMSKNAHLIRTLYQYGLQDDIPVPEVMYDTLLKYCRGLVDIHGDARNMEEWTRMKELAHMNTGLQYLELRLDLSQRRHCDYSLYTMFTRSVGDGSQGHSQLKSLKLVCTISVETLKRILLACPALEYATIAEVSKTTMETEPCDNSSSSSNNNQGREWSEHQTPTSLPPLSSKLRHLCINDYCDDPTLADLLECLPSLTSLDMPDIDFLVSQRLRQTAEDGFLRQLKTIKFRELAETSSSRFLLPVLRAIPQHQLQDVTLKSVELIETKFLIDHQHRSLERVVLYDAPPEALVALLTRCPYLKELSVSGNGPVDVRQLLNQPWACTSSLRELSATVCLPPATEGVDTAMIENEFMMKLGQCTQLRELFIGQDCGRRTVQLKWSLAHGLYHLASLSHLKLISFGNWMSFEVPELQFMKEHWPQLKCLPEVKPTSDATSTWLRDNWPTMEVSSGEDDEPYLGIYHFVPWSLYLED